MTAQEMRCMDRVWHFETSVSAAGWVDRDTLLVASADALLRLDVDSSATEPVIALEADNPVTRSNDGRADPWGGFWIGTMGRNYEPGAGSIYRYWRGELRALFTGLTITNSICFAPDHSAAYWTDTLTRKIMRQPLSEADGWPVGESTVLIDFTKDGLAPDGAVTDAAGNLWIAQWGAGRVACHGPDGRFLHAVAVPASQSTCPAFGGTDLTTLFVTSAAEGLDGPQDGATFAIPGAGRGLPEPQVIL